MDKKIKNYLNSVKTLSALVLLVPGTIFTYTTGYGLLGISLTVIGAFTCLLAPLTISLFVASSIVTCCALQHISYNVNVIFSMVIAISCLVAYVTTEEKKLVERANIV